MEPIFMSTGNSKTNEPHRFRLTLVDKLNLKDPSKNIALANLSIYPNRNMELANLSIYYTWKTLNLPITINLKFQTFKIILNMLKT